MHQKHKGRHSGWRRLIALLIGAVAVFGTGVSPASASVPGTSVLGASTAALRDFDAVTTANERNVWKHMALIGSQYVIFNDRGIIEGPASIQAKWPFLPEQFTHDVDSAGIAFSGPGFRWRHTWTKGNQAIVFEDSGIVTGPITISSPYDGLSDYNVPGSYLAYHMAVRGENYVFFQGYDYQAPSRPLSYFSFLPERFKRDLDDVSLEIEGSTAKYSFYQGNERIIFDQNGRVFELANLDAKWPFLNYWRSTV
ncbi:hypothetical protein AB0395_41755 [Streptosporangium sp. NPDC051023]|uniref:hypothetical protein n=1 Tax=Streptosporangium sp. NPDC051023 TaxID=3155410 RepID=UPI00344BA274